MTSTTEIATRPEKVWDFFLNLEDNYKRWHPEEHEYWRWKKGNPLEIGAKIDSLEIVDGHKSRIRAVVVDSIENEKIGLKPNWPISIMCPKLEWIIEDKGDKVDFIAKTYYKFGKIFRTLNKNAASEIMDLTQKHMDEEGENLKRILESTG